MLVVQSCPTVCDPVDWSPPGSSVHEIFQARILEWVAISFSRGPSQPRNWTGVSWIAGGLFTNWAIKKAPHNKLCITTNCGKFFKRWEYQTTWPASWEGQEATVRTGHGITDWFQIGKGVHQGCILSPCLFNLYAEYIMRNAGLEEAQAGIKISRRNINNLRYADDTTLMQ